MAIEDRDRKILWARAHNSCAVCKTTLILGGTKGDRESVVGDEAHIVARSKGGPRAGLINSSDLDKYENLILLCKVHHKQVDDQPITYTVDHLRQLKAEHERWAHAKFGELAADSRPAQVDDAANELVQSARSRLAEAIQIAEGDVVLTAYPVKKEFVVSRSGEEEEEGYSVPEGFDMLLLDLEQMFEVALDGTGVSAENTWWRLGFDPADEINEYTARRMTFTLMPGHVRPPYGIRVTIDEKGKITKHGYRPDLELPEWRGGYGTGPRKLHTLIFDTRLVADSAVNDGYDFQGPWAFRIIDDPDKGKCIEGFCEAMWKKPERWRLLPK
ncbi:HNH endonuclease [Nocardia tenerifensis]|uniref:HNH endonuclease n=1 Tax=Nocardia tenerifensis TaxID=228006 RepID=UPI0012F6FAF0|nr:HNH endonuclease signature motif containing protein [Nocardia tenerifensis]